MNRRFLLAPLAAAFVGVLALSSIARADFTFTQGAGPTAFSFTVTTGGTSTCAAANTHCFASVPIDSAGAQLFAISNPAYVQFPSAQSVTGAGGTFPATQSGTWNVGQVGTWTVTGAGGTFPATQSGGWSVSQSGSWTVAATQSGAWTVTGAGGTFPATQSGAWNITNITGSVSLPTGAATAANQATTNSTLSSILSAVTGAIPTQAPTIDIGAVGISQTSDGTTNLVRLGAETTKNIGTINPGNTPNTAPWLFVLRDGSGQARSANVNAAFQLSVSCDAGCTSGNFNNNADNVATSSTNGQAAAWNYVWDGAGWDRLYGDSTSGAFVQVKASVLPTGAATAANQVLAVGAIGATAPTSASLGGCIGSSAEQTAVTNGQLTAVTCGLGGKQIVVPYTVKELATRGNGSSTDTAAHTIIAAAAGSNKNYVVAVQCKNSSATAVDVTFNDVVTAGSGTASGLYLPATGGNNATFPVPLVTAAATAFQFTSSAGVSTVSCNAQGYIGL